MVRAARLDRPHAHAETGRTPPTRSVEPSAGRRSRCRRLRQQVLDPQDRPFDVEGTLLVFLRDGEGVELIWVAQPPTLTSERPVWGRDVVVRVEGPTRERLVAGG